MNTDKHRWIFGFASAFIGVYLWLVCSALHADWQVKPVSSLQKLTAVAPNILESFKTEPIKLRAARGEWENFQIVIQASDISAVNSAEQPLIKRAEVIKIQKL